jgi:hypothetical protein
LLIIAIDTPKKSNDNAIYRKPSWKFVVLFKNNLVKLPIPTENRSVKDLKKIMGANTKAAFCFFDIK